jgi:1-acyl-sn-glycerol-3-phosphate acyltransferase
VKRLSEWYFRLAGWTFEGAVPDEPKLVIVGYPHTSNWDLFALLAIIRHFDLHVSFLAHRGLFVGPLGWLLRRWGAIAVQGGITSVVATVDEMFATSERLHLVIAPEGTRAGGAWKSGFWRIADTADVPVAMGFIDGGTKRLGFGPSRRIDGDPAAWMDEARRFYEDKMGLKPDNRGPFELSV